MSGAGRAGTGSVIGRVQLAIDERGHNLFSMPYIRLTDERTGDALEFDSSVVRVGRSDQEELAVVGEGREVVSSTHLRLVHRDGSWWIEDLGSRNGTFVNDRRLIAGAAEKIEAGFAFRLGTTGPKFTVEAARAQRISSTLGEVVPIRPSAPTVKMAGLDSPGPKAPVRPTELRIVLVGEAGESFEATGKLLRIGRGADCELRPVGPGDTSISRVHSEIVLDEDGRVIIRDAGSRNGTIVNGNVIDSPHFLKLGDRIKMGAVGVDLEVRELTAPGPLPPVVTADPQVAPPRPPPAASQRKSRRPSWMAGSFGGKGATVFFRDMFEESTRKTKVRMRWIIWTFTILLSGGLGAMYWVGEQRVRTTSRQLQEQSRLLVEQQAVADSLRSAASADYERLRLELESARDAAAPAVVVESLRVALTEARDRTEALEAALIRAQRSMDRQIAMGDSIRSQAQAELNRLRAELGGARGRSESSALLDSLRKAVQDAQVRATNIEAQVRAVKGVDLVSVSQANQGAIALVTTYFSDGIFDGSGFALSSSGYFVTNRHVVMADGKRPDSVFVTMADHRSLLRAEVIAIAAAGGPDLAVLEVQGYTGPHVLRIDWTGSHMRQGEPAALIGFPAGVAAALDASQTVRTSMSAGIFSKITPEMVQFDGFTVGGSSGSPIFNASGEVVAVHRAGLKEAVGLGFGVPIAQLISILPERVKAELGLR